MHNYFIKSTSESNKMSMKSVLASKIQRHRNEETEMESLRDHARPEPLSIFAMTVILVSQSQFLVTKASMGDSNFYPIR